MPEAYQIPVGDAWAAILCACLFGLTGLLVDGLILIRLMVRPIRFQRLSDNMRAVPLNLNDAGLVAIPVMIVWGLVHGVASVAMQKHWLPESPAPYVQILITLFAFHVPGIVVVLALLRKRGITLARGFGLAWRGAPRYAGYGLVLGLAALPVLWLTTALYDLLLVLMGVEIGVQPVMQMLLNAASYPWWGQVILALLAIVVVPAIEEILFRGIALPALSKSYGLVVGIILTSLVFGVMHVHVPSYLPLFLLSVGLCLAYAYTGSILVPIIIHSTFNLVSITILWLSVLTGHSPAG